MHETVYPSHRHLRLNPTVFETGVVWTFTNKGGTLRELTNFQSSSVKGLITLYFGPPQGTSVVKPVSATWHPL